MFYKIYQPHTALKEFINNIEVIHVPSDIPITYISVLNPPVSEKRLFFYPYELPEVEYIGKSEKELQPRSILVGRQVSRVQLSMKPHTLCIKVGFQPSGLYRLLGIPLNEYEVDGALDSRYALDKDILFINEQLQAAASFDQMVSLIQAFFLKKLNKLRSTLPIDAVLMEVVKKGGLMTVEDMANTACISFRQLERQFQQRIGMTPKFFARLTRFAKAWAMKEGNPTMSWTNIAYHCGYFDQMHFIRDFKDFAGVPPSVIEAEIKEFPNLLPIKMLYD
jgi:AraC-like DNA-binding protein